MDSLSETNAELARINERNVDDFYRQFACIPGSEVLETEDVLRCYTGALHPVANIATRFLATSDKFAQTVSDCTRYFRDKGCPFAVFLGPCSRPANAANVLSSLGYSLASSMPGMSIGSDSGLFTVRPTDGLEIREPSTELEISEWIKTCSIGSNMPLQVLDLMRPLVQHPENSSSRVRLFTAYIDRDPVGTSLLHLNDESGGIFCVSVLSEFRNQGIGAAVTARAVNYTRESGCQFATLQASAMGEPVYRRLGFTCQGTFDLWMIPANQENVINKE